MFFIFYSNIQITFYLKNIYSDLRLGNVLVMQQKINGLFLVC